MVDSKGGRWASGTNICSAQKIILDLRPFGTCVLQQADEVEISTCTFVYMYLTTGWLPLLGLLHVVLVVVRKRRNKTSSYYLICSTFEVNQ